MQCPQMICYERELGKDFVAELTAVSPTMLTEFMFDPSAAGWKLRQTLWTIVMGANIGDQI